MEYDPKTGTFETSVVARSTKDDRLSNRGLGGDLSKRRRRIERMIKNNHGTVENMEQVFERLRILAMGKPAVIDFGDGAVEYTIKADAQFMKLYLDRVIGPVRNDEQIEREVEKRLAQMLDLAEREARKRSESIEVKESKDK